MSKQDMSGFWTGLGVALVLLAFMAPLIFLTITAGQNQQKCIEQRGDWNQNKSECTFKEK